MGRKQPAGGPVWLAGFLLMMAGVGSAACRGTPPPSGPAREVRDGLGRVVPVPPNPRRLVSLAPSATESLVAIGFGGRLVGISDFCDPPPGSPSCARIGGMLNPDLEAIRALRPDLLVGSTSGNDPSLASQADGLGLPLYILHTPDIESVLTGLEDLASALGDRPAGAALVSGLRARLDRLAERLEGRARPRVLFIIWSEPLVVPGGPAFLTDALRRAGAASVTGDAAAPHPAFDLESAIARAPEVILTTEENRRLAERLPRDPAWAGVPAVRRGRVHVLGGAIVRPGPGVVDGIEEAARLIHPGAFGAPAAAGPVPGRDRGAEKE